MCLLPTDDVAPYFKTEPVRTQVHLEGNRLVLTCMAEGSWPLEFKWLHNNKELTKFSLEYRQAALPLPSAPGAGGGPGATALPRGVPGWGACAVVWGAGSLAPLLLTGRLGRQKQTPKRALLPG